MTLSLAEKSYLLRRTCFSASDSLLSATDAFTTKESLVNWLIEQPLANYNYPQWYLSPPDTQSLSKDERKALRKEHTRALQLWWQTLLINSSSPLHEQMVLFWHNHFVSSIQKVKSPNAMLAQNDLFRQQGLGNFKSLLSAVLKDPAMLIYLDNANSKKESPNENLARELLELFTLGEGNYSEQDIKELARALTGNSVNRRTGHYQFKHHWHDATEKNIFGESGNFSGEDLAELITDQPACAPFIVSKLWRHFINDTPDEAEVTFLAQIFVENNFELKPLLHALLLSNAFWQSQGQLLKSPVQLIVGTYRQFELTELTDSQWRSLTKNMGQQLFAPPNVKGWPGGKAWYSSAAIFYREAFIYKFARWHDTSTLTTSKAQLLAVEPVASIDDISTPEQLALAMADPAYQVQ